MSSLGIEAHKVDVFVLRDRPFSREEMARGVRVPVTAETTLRLSTPEDKKISYAANGVISIPAAAYTKSARDVKVMKSFTGGMQLFLPRFSRNGITIMRGGAWEHSGMTDFRCADRGEARSRTRRTNAVGFRCAVADSDLWRASPRGVAQRKKASVKLGKNHKFMNLCFIGTPP